MFWRIFKVLIDDIRRKSVWYVLGGICLWEGWCYLLFKLSGAGELGAADWFCGGVEVRCRGIEFFHEAIYSLLIFSGVEKEHFLEVSF